MRRATKRVNYRLQIVDRPSLQAQIRETVATHGTLAAAARFAKMEESTLRAIAKGRSATVNTAVFDGIRRLIGDSPKLWRTVSPIDTQPYFVDNAYWQQERATRFARAPLKRLTNFKEEHVEFLAGDQTVSVDVRGTDNQSPIFSARALRMQDIDNTIAECIRRYPAEFLPLFTERDQNNKDFLRLYISLVRTVEPLAECRHAGLCEPALNDMEANDLRQFIKLGVRRELIISKQSLAFTGVKDLRRRLSAISWEVAEDPLKKLEQLDDRRWPRGTKHGLIRAMKDLRFSLGSQKR